MSGKSRTAAFGRTIALSGAILGAVAVTPAFADPIDVMTSVRVANITQPTTPQEQKVVQFRVARAAEAACGSDERSLSDYRTAVRRSQCFHDSYADAMAQLTSRWGGGAGR